VLEEMWVTEDAQSGRAWEVKRLSFEVEGHSEKNVSSYSVRRLIGSLWASIKVITITE